MPFFTGWQPKKKHRLQGNKKTLASDVWRLGLILAQRWGRPSLAGGFCATLNTYKHALCRYNADKFAKYRLRGYTFLLYIWDIERLQVDSSASP